MNKIRHILKLEVYLFHQHNKKFAQCELDKIMDQFFCGHDLLLNSCLEINLSKLT